MPVLTAEEEEEEEGDYTKATTDINDKHNPIYASHCNQLRRQKRPSAMQQSFDKHVCNAGGQLCIKRDCKCHQLGQLSRSRAGHCTTVKGGALFIQLH